MPFPKTREALVAAGYTFVETKPCRYGTCTATIEWYRTPKDKLMPMNHEGEFVPHFATCPGYHREIGPPGWAKEI